ncbi:hypothetical protein ACQ4N7_14975 [Nodosilinea sp. AN01ver1]|uniref:hypothetical protein n=1 Tax=Nodosilinea sp. AN01ver1 TaxID=3423362 RepID=UPI003D312EA5
MDKLASVDLTPSQHAIDRYESALAKVESGSGSACEPDVIALLLARDGVEREKQSGELDEASSMRLLALDKRLKQQASAINAATSLAHCRDSLSPPSSAWWWSLEPPPPALKVQKLDQFDWVWHLLTVTCLVFSASFATNTARAFSTQGFDLMGTISTITQGAGVALVAGGALTDKGRKVTENILHSLKIPPVFYAEATFGFSALLLGGTFVLNSNLAKVGDIYQRQGDRLLNQGSLVSARKKYLRATDFDPNDQGLVLALGEVSQKLGELDQAETYYRQGLALDAAAAMDGLARTLVLKEIETKGWNSKIDDLAARRAEFFLEAALVKLPSHDDVRDRAINLLNTPQPQLTHRDQMATTLADMQQRASVHLNKGLLNLAQIDFNNLDIDAAERLLDYALVAFDEATLYEDAFAEMLANKKVSATDWPELGKAACYRQIVAQVQAEIFYQPGVQLYELFQGSQDCYNALRSAGLNRYDDAIMYYRLSYEWGDRIPPEAYEPSATK